MSCAVICPSWISLWNNSPRTFFNIAQEQSIDFVTGHANKFFSFQALSITIIFSLRTCEVMTNQSCAVETTSNLVLDVFQIIRSIRQDRNLFDLCPGSHVILVGLIDAGFLYDAMSGRYHPLGEYRKNIKYKVTCKLHSHEGRVHRVLKSLWRYRTEPVFVNVYGAQESIPPAYIACMAGRYGKQGCLTGPPSWESIPGLLKRCTHTGPGF